MDAVTERSEALRAALVAHRDAVAEVLGRYAARNARIFGSVARGDAHADSDLDLIVDLNHGGNELLRVSGIGEELSEILGVRVDVVTSSLLREQVSVTAERDAVPL